MYVADVPDPVNPPWSELLSATVGARVQRYRKLRGLTAQQVSDLLMSSLGVDMKRTVLGGLESGARKAVSLSEVLALAYVLGVPPVLLMSPLGETGEVEAVPGVDLDTWDFTRWITGEGLPPDGIATPQWRQNVDLLALHREHAAKERDWKEQTHLAVVGDSAEQIDGMFERALGRRREIEDGLRLIRRAIRGRGDLPPALAQELAHLDDGEPEPRLRQTREAGRGTDVPVERAIDERRKALRSTKDGDTDE